MATCPDTSGLSTRPNVQPERFPNIAVESQVEFGVPVMRADWKEPVEVELGAIGSYRVIASTEDAAKALLYRWPISAGSRWLRAQQFCLDALEGKASADDARAAFLAAADEADVSVRPWQRDLPEGKSVGTRWGKRKSR